MHELQTLEQGDLPGALRGTGGLKKGSNGGGDARKF